MILIIYCDMNYIIMKLIMNDYDLLFNDNFKLYIEC